MKLAFAGYVVSLAVRQAPKPIEDRSTAPMGVAALVGGRCPYCGYRICGIDQGEDGTITWSCLDGCNP